MALVAHGRGFPGREDCAEGYFRRKHALLKRTVTIPVMLDAALQYVEYGWATFPVPPGTKKSYKSAKFSNGARWGASNKPAVLRRDFGRTWREANIGIPTGAENGFWVLEADTPKGHGVDGIELLRELERKHSRLPKTLMAMSPSGSLHYYFRWPKGGLIVRNSASAIAPGIDVRGEGGMVLAPPSKPPGVGHGLYIWLNWGTRIAYAPQWLIDLVVSKKSKKAAAKAKKLEDKNLDADVDLIEAALCAIGRACARQRHWPY